MTLREHWLGGTWRSTARAVLQPTGLILDLPVLFGLVIASLTTHRSQAWRWLNWALAGIAVVTLMSWIIGICRRRRPFALG